MATPDKTVPVNIPLSAAITMQRNMPLSTRLQPGFGRGYAVDTNPRSSPFAAQQQAQHPFLGGWQVLTDTLPPLTSLTPLTPFSHLAIPYAQVQQQAPYILPKMSFSLPPKPPAPMDFDKEEMQTLEGLGIDLNFSNLVTTSTAAQIPQQLPAQLPAIPQEQQNFSSGFMRPATNIAPLNMDLSRSLDEINEPSQPTRHLLVDCSHLNDVSYGGVLQLLTGFQDTKCIFTDRILSDAIAVVSFFDVRHAMSSLQKMQNEMGWTAHYYDGRCLEMVTSKEYAVRAREYEADVLCIVKPKIGTTTTDAMVYRALTTFGPVWNLSRINGADGHWFWVRFYDCRQCKVVLDTKSALIDGMILEFKASEISPIAITPDEAFGISSPIATESTFSPSSLGSFSGFMPPPPGGFEPYTPSTSFGSSDVFQAQTGVADKHTATSLYSSSPLKGEGSFTSQLASPYEYRGLFLEESSTKNAINLEKIAMGHDTRTTIMLRNIPNKVDQATLKEFIDETSMGAYNFLYLRIDFKNLCNVGYAFINFIDPLDIIPFVKARGGKRWNRYNSEKVLDVTYANIQGIDGLIEKFRNSSVMDQAESFRPKLFYSSGPLRGMEMEFPPANNLNRKLRSINAAQHVGLFTPKSVPANSKPIWRK